MMNNFIYNSVWHQWFSKHIMCQMIFLEHAVQHYRNIIIICSILSIVKFS